MNSARSSTQTGAPASDNSAATKASAVAPDSNAQAAVVDDSEYMTAYMPLPYAYDPSELEGGSGGARSAASGGASFLWFAGRRNGCADQVTADMVVSQDGTPQAIRLVAQSDANTDSDF